MKWFYWRNESMNKVEKRAQICMKLNELYARKNADYGDSFGKSFTEYGLTMACIRLEDKLNRIKSLSKKEAQVSDESLVDTLMDLANYSIMTLVELAQSEPEKAPEKAPEAEEIEHESSCLRAHPHCLCNTCMHDLGDEACCVNTYGFGTCPISECPGYAKEG
jgi:hypothetical protein